MHSHAAPMGILLFKSIRLRLLGPGREAVSILKRTGTLSVKRTVADDGSAANDQALAKAASDLRSPPCSRRGRGSEDPVPGSRSALRGPKVDRDVAGGAMVSADVRTSP